MIITATVDARVLRVSLPTRLVDLLATPVPRLVSAPTDPVLTTDRDAVVLRNEDALTVTDYGLTPIIIGNPTGQPVYESDNPAVATIQNSAARHVSPGTANISVKVDDVGPVTRELTFADITQGTIDRLQYFVVGSLARDCADAVDGRIAGKNPATAKALFTTRDHAAGTYVRNAGFWGTDIDLTCCAVYTQTQQPDLRALTLVAPDVGIMATHYEVQPGAVVRFVTADNQTVERVVVSKLSMRDFVGLNADVSLARLDSPAPASITPCKILPANWQDWLPEINPFRPVPAFGINRNRSASVFSQTTLTQFSFTTAPGGAFIPYPVPEDGLRRDFWQAMAVGDSGNPGFFIIGGEPVLKNIYSHVSGGVHIGHFAPTLNAMMAQLGSPHQLQTADLSAFPTFEP